jgi:hypothetical protein
MVKTGAIVLPGNRRREFHELTIVEIVSNLREQFIGNLNRSPRHGHRILKGAFFEIAQMGTRFEVDQRLEFSIAQTRLSADGRTDVNSERTTNFHGHFEDYKSF